MHLQNFNKRVRDNDRIQLNNKQTSIEVFRYLANLDLTKFI